MNYRGTTIVSRLAVLFAVLFAVTACGGGGGGSTFYDGDGDEAALTMSFAMFDPQGNATNTVTAASPGTLKVSLKGKDTGNVLVSAQTSLGTLSPATGTALTDSSGVATFRLAAGPERGAGTVTASATTTSGSVTGSFAFQVGDGGLRLGFFDTDGMFVENQILIEPESTLSADGSAQLSVVILDKDGNRVTTAEEVSFSSGCVAAGQATVNPELPRALNGQASTLYTAAGCSGTDNITASLLGGGAQAFGTLSIASPQANRINFVEADPLLIVLRGTGGQGRQETSDVVFQIVDGSGTALAGANVEFGLTTYVGGLTLSKTSQISNGDGDVSVTVQAGDIPTVVRVIASVQNGDGQLVSTVSDLLTVTTGLPDQDSISLAVGDSESSLVVDGAMRIDGLCRTLVVSMADRFNNPVVDGTAAVFRTEYGVIASSCATVNGTCSVEWCSQTPRFPTLTGAEYVVSTEDNQGETCPSHNGSNAIPCPDDLGAIRGGRSTILVTAIGEESFVDRNGNGIMDEDEKALFQNIPEAFLDENEDGVYTPAISQCLAAPTGSLQCISGQEEEFIDFNTNRMYDLNDDPAVYNGLLCPIEGDGVWCSRSLVNVRDSVVVSLGDAPNFDLLVANGRRVLGDTDTLPLDVPLTLYIADTFNNPPPGGATVSLSASGNCSVLGPTSFDVPNTNARGAFGLNFSLIRALIGLIPGTLTITLDTPEASSEVTYNCAAPPVDPEES